MVEGVALVVGGELLGVEGVIALGSRDRAGALVEGQAHRTRDIDLRRCEERIQTSLQRGIPLAVVDLVGPLVFHMELVVEHVALETDVLKRLVRLDDGKRARSLVALAALHADEAVLHHVEAAEAVRAGDLVHLEDDVEVAHLLAVERAGDAVLERDLHDGRGVGSLLGVGGHRIDVRRRLVPGVFQNTALDGAAPQVVVDRIGRLLGGGNFHPVRRRPVHLLRTGLQIPLANRGDDFQRRIEHHDGRLKAHLIVALAGAAVRHVLRAELVRDLDEMLRDQRARESGHERVLVLVERVRGERGGKVFLGEFLAHVDHAALDGAGAQGLVVNLLETVMLLSNIANDGDDVEPALLLHPLDAHRRIKATGVGQDNPVPLFAHFLYPFPAQNCFNHGKPNAP